MAPVLHLDRSYHLNHELIARGHFVTALFATSGAVALDPVEMDFVRGHFWKMNEIEKIGEAQIVGPARTFDLALSSRSPKRRVRRTRSPASNAGRPGIRKRRRGCTWTMSSSTR